MFRYTEKKLAAEICKAAKQFDAGVRSEYLSDSQTLKLFGSGDTDESPVVVYLGNLFAKVRNMSRSDRETVITNTLQESFSDKTISSEELLQSLALRVRTPIEVFLRRRYIELHAMETPDPMKYGDGGSVFLELVADSEDTVSSVSKAQLDKSDISEEEAFRIAAANLARATDEHQWTEVCDSIWVSSYQDDYDFARLLAANDDIKLPFESTIILFAPSHSICLITDSDDPEVISKMIELGYQYSEDHRPFSNILWTQTSGEWTEWTPEVDDPTYSIAELQRLRDLIASYDEQKANLEQLLESRDEDSFVAGFQVFDRENGYETLCTYTLNIPSYLPKTDTVALVDSEAPDDDSVLGMLPWEQFAAAVGPQTLVPMTDENPARFQLTGRLTEVQEDTLRTQVTPMG